MHILTKHASKRLEKKLRLSAFLEHLDEELLQYKQLKEIDSILLNAPEEIVSYLGVPPDMRLAAPPAQNAGTKLAKIKILTALNAIKLNKDFLPPDKVIEADKLIILLESYLTNKDLTAAGGNKAINLEDI